VICLDNLRTGRSGNIAHLADRPGFTFIQHDVVEPLPPLPRVERVYHLASPASPRAYQCWPLETMRVNSEGTQRLLELAERDSARFLYTSTSEVYGDPLEHPQRETYRGNVSTIGPRAMYDEGKRYGEALTVTFGLARSVDVCIARPFNTYGPRMDRNDGRVVSNFITQALDNRPLTVHGDGSHSRSFQYVDDLVEGLLRLMGSGSRGPVNLGNPEEYTMLQLAHLIRELAGSDSEIVFAPLPGDDPRQRRPDISLAKRLLGWEPTVPVREGLVRTIAHFRSCD
jgi:nucleoside-diphosphate-sugar epimerase